ncbi:hypothetical protein [Mumia sp. Pv 4-285]|uniref:hypothetical protein n=1 Tax=Mumia qirimensis TaxID=3234852 RepID=UPI00351CE32E
MRRSAMMAAVAVAVGVTAVPASATSCAQIDPVAQLERVDAVFVGTPTTSAADDDTVVVAVTDVYKGEVPSTTPVVMEPDMGDDPPELATDQQYVFFVQDVDGALVSGVCSGTAPVDDAVLDALEAASSDRSAYRPASPTPTGAFPTPVEESEAAADPDAADGAVVVDGASDDVNAISPVLVGVVIVALVGLVVLAPGYLRRRARKDSVGPTP